MLMGLTEKLDNVQKWVNNVNREIGNYKKGLKRNPRIQKH